MNTATNPAALLLALDAAINAQGRRARGTALRAVHAAMLAASLPKTSHLWAKLDDAYDADM